MIAAVARAANSTRKAGPFRSSGAGMPTATSGAAVSPTRLVARRAWPQSQRGLGTTQWLATFTRRQARSEPNRRSEGGQMSAGGGPSNVTA